MRRIYKPAAPGLSVWQEGLANPERHWKRGRSAFELAVTWEAAAKTERGLPTQVAALLDQQSGTKGSTLLLAFPEHKVSVPGRGFPSQTDVWALLKTLSGSVSIAVEGKAGEDFGGLVQKWLGNAPQNKSDRLEGLCQILQLPSSQVGDLHYQLLHRAASAILEAQRFGASQAVLLVQYFGDAAKGFNDYKIFAERMGAVGVTQGQLVSARPISGLPFYLGWLDSPFATDAQVVQVSISSSSTPFTFAEMQAQVAEGFAALGMTEEELDDYVVQFVKQVRAEMRAHDAQP